MEPEQVEQKDSEEDQYNDFEENSDEGQGDAQKQNDKNKGLSASPAQKDLSNDKLEEAEYAYHIEKSQEEIRE